MSAIKVAFILLFIQLMFLLGCKKSTTPAQFSPTQEVTESGKKTQYRVKLRINAEFDEKARDNVISFIGQSLISLGGIAIVNDNPDYRIYITLSQSKLRGCKFIGHIMSIVVAKAQRDSFYLDKIPHFNSLPKHIQLNIMQYDERLEFHSIYSCGDDNLEATCKSIIGDINANVFLKKLSESANFEDKDK